MNNEFPSADLILLGFIAVFILLRLRGTLGKKTGFDIRDQPKDDRAETGTERIIQLPERVREREAKRDALPLSEVKHPDAASGIAAIEAVDPAFDAREFLSGAKSAFGMVFDAFANDDRATLRGLLADDVYAKFERELKDREGTETRTETTLVSVTPLEISEAKLDRATARLTVRFETEQVTVTRDTQNVIVEGDPSHVETDEVEWVFERDLRSKNPNWKIMDT